MYAPNVKITMRWRKTNYCREEFKKTLPRFHLKNHLLKFAWKGKKGSLFSAYGNSFRPGMRIFFVRRQFREVGRGGFRRNLKRRGKNEPGRGGFAVLPPVYGCAISLAPAFPPPIFPKSISNTFNISLKFPLTMALSFWRGNNGCFHKTPVPKSRLHLKRNVFFEIQNFSCPFQVFF